jgi:hypothetical protein
MLKIPGGEDYARQLMERPSASTATSASTAASAAATTAWLPVDIPLSEAASAGGDQPNASATPIARLARGDIPAVIVRGALTSAECTALLHQFAADGRYPDDFIPLLKPGNVPNVHCDGNFEEGRGSGWCQSNGVNERFDVGTALGNLGADQENFFANAQITNALYGKLFGDQHQKPTRGSACTGGVDDGSGGGGAAAASAAGSNTLNPIAVLHRALADLSGGKIVGTPAEPSGEPFAGQPYGPAIFRSHLPGFGYAPHIDSVVVREKRTNYKAVHKHSVQLGGVLLLQAPERVVLDGPAKTPGYTMPDTDGKYHDTILYHAPCTKPDVKELIERISDTRPGGAKGQMRTAEFRTFAADTALEQYSVDLQVGDLYFFKADSIHEVPAFGGNFARMNMATFIGFDEQGDDVSVWS